MTWLEVLGSGGDYGEVSAASYVQRKEDELSDPFSSKFLAISKFLYTNFRTKLNVASLTNRSHKRSWSYVNKAISDPKKVQLISTTALSLWAFGVLSLIPSSINFVQLTFSDSTPAIIEITLLNKLNHFNYFVGWSAGGIHDDYMLIKLELVHPRKMCIPEKGFRFLQYKKVLSNSYSLDRSLWIVY